MTTPPTQEQGLLACRVCGSECSVEVFPSTDILDGGCVLWLCSKHKLFGGDCPSETAYFSEETWNDQPATRPQPASPPPGEDIVGRVAKALYARTPAWAFTPSNVLPWERLSPEDWEPYLADARVAISAMPSPPPSPWREIGEEES